MLFRYTLLYKNYSFLNPVLCQLLSQGENSPKLREIPQLYTGVSYTRIERLSHSPCKYEMQKIILSTKSCEL